MSVIVQESDAGYIPLAEDPLTPMRVFGLKVSKLESLSPHFRRITFTGPSLDYFGTGPHGQTLDLRIKVLIPSPGHPLPPLRHVRGSLQQDWYQLWRAEDESMRGVMRTYTVRALRPAVSGSSEHSSEHSSENAVGSSEHSTGSRDSSLPPAELDIDFVLHFDGATGSSGPAAQWAAAAQLGDELTLIGPCARSGDCMGIEFSPGNADRVLLVGDETAVPAIAAILETLPPHVAGHAVLEVPSSADFLDISTRANVEVRWHARNGQTHGELMDRDVRTVIVPAACQRGQEPEDVNVDEAILWETPEATSGHGLYAWIAGEAAAIRTLRCYLVAEVGMDRDAVAFMGYWRQGKALPQ